MQQLKTRYLSAYLIFTGSLKTIVYQPSAFWPRYSDVQMLKESGKLFPKRAYDDERDPDRSPSIIHFPSRYLDDNTIELNLSYFSSMDKTFEKKFPEFAKNGNDIGFKPFLFGLKNKAEYSTFVKQFTYMFIITVNDSVHSNLEFVVDRNNKTKELNFVTALDIRHLPYGFVHVKAEYPYFDESSDSLTTRVIDITLIKR